MNNPSFQWLAFSAISFIICRFLLIKYPSKGINTVYGYRMRFSMKTQKQWNFAQVRSARKILGSDSSF